MDEQFGDAVWCLTLVDHGYLVAKRNHFDKRDGKRLVSNRN
jgi:hypothetical protein